MTFSIANIVEMHEYNRFANCPFTEHTWTLCQCHPSKKPSSLMANQRIVNCYIMPNAPAGSATVSTINRKRCANAIIEFRWKCMMSNGNWRWKKSSRVWMTSPRYSSHFRKDWTYDPHALLSITKSQLHFHIICIRFQFGADYDVTLMAFDCFHMSQKGHRYVYCTSSIIHCDWLP